MNTFCDPSAVSVLHTIVQVCCDNDFKKIFNITFFKDKYRSLPCSIMWAICIKYKMVILNLVYSSMQPFSKNCFKFFTEALTNLINDKLLSSIVYLVDIYIIILSGFPSIYSLIYPTTKAMIYWTFNIQNISINLITRDQKQTTSHMFYLWTKTKT